MALRQLYYPVEQALLCDYFDEGRPEELFELDIWEPDPLAPDKTVHLEQPRCSGVEGLDLALENAVARIALTRVQERLPQWFTSRDGKPISGRQLRAIADRDLLLLPLHLFTLNWADSGPGFSWPESYHVTWFPLFNRYVVTASADCPDVWGYEDRALGHFGPEKNPIEGAREVITRFWRWQLDDYDKSRWAYLFFHGAVSNAEANAWADAVWGAEACCEECCEEDEE